MLNVSGYRTLLNLSAKSTIRKVREYLILVLLYLMLSMSISKSQATLKNVLLRLTSFHRRSEPPEYNEGLR